MLQVSELCTDYQDSLTPPRALLFRDKYGSSCASTKSISSVTGSTNNNDEALSIDAALTKDEEILKKSGKLLVEELEKG
ncbi:hypothetical protein Tco_1538562 [Tanacetum coccineum]